MQLLCCCCFCSGLGVYFASLRQFIVAALLLSLVAIYPLANNAVNQKWSNAYRLEVDQVRGLWILARACIISMLSQQVALEHLERARNEVRIKQRQHCWCYGPNSRGASSAHH